MSWIAQRNTLLVKAEIALQQLRNHWLPFRVRAARAFLGAFYRGRELRVLSVGGRENAKNERIARSGDFESALRKGKRAGTIADRALGRSGENPG
jgi:hypothetical protein